MIRVLRPLLCLALAAGGLVRGAAPLPPTDITSDEFDSNTTAKETTTYFTGHVVVTGNNLKITCDKLTVISLPQAGKSSDPSREGQKFKYLLATGNVHILQGEREATCGRADVYPLDDKMVLTQNPVVTDHANNSVATGDKLVLLHGQRKVTGTHVHISGPPIKDMGFDKSLPAPSPSP
jgi:lipopolysaccharide export system protein LptA